MKVSELIERLSALAPDLDVVARGYEDGEDDVTDVDLVHLHRNKWNKEDTWYYGEHQVVDKPGPGTVRAVRLS